MGARNKETSRFVDEVTSDVRKICVSYCDTEKCFYMGRYSHFRFLQVEPDEKIVHDGQRVESEYT